MKPYKTKEMNDKVRNAVHTAEAYFQKNPSSQRKYLTNDEFAYDICHICNVPYSIAKRVTWFIRSDGYRDQIALDLWGFNKHTA